MANHYDRKSIQELASIVNAGKAAETQNLEAGRKKAAQNKVLQENGLYYKQVDSPYGKLNDEVLKSVADNWADTVYYDLADPEDVQRRNTGKLPKYYDDKYDLDDPYDAWLYENNLPYKTKFNSIYDDKYDAWATDYNKRVEEVNKKLTEEQLINSLKTDAANALLADPEADRQKIVHDLLTTEEYQPLIDMYYQIIEDEDDPYGYNNIKNFGKEADETKLTNNDIFSLYEEVMGNDYGVTSENLAKIQKLENEAAEYRKKAASATGRRKQNFERSADMAEKQAEKLKADGVKYVEPQADAKPEPQSVDLVEAVMNGEDAVDLSVYEPDYSGYEGMSEAEVASDIATLTAKRDRLKAQANQATQQVVGYSRIGNKEKADEARARAAELNEQAKAVDAQIASMEREAVDATVLSSMSAVINNPDFAQYSEMGAALENETYTAEDLAKLKGADLRRARIMNYNKRGVQNKVTAAKENPALYESSGRGIGFSNDTTGEYYLLSLMNDDEVAVYNYHLAKYGEDEAQEYLDALNPTLKARRRAAQEADTAKRTLENPFLYNAASVVMQNASGLTGIVAAVAGAAGYELDPNDDLFAGSRFAQTVRETTAQEIADNAATPFGENITPFLYQTGMSIIDNASMIATGLPQPVTLALMGSAAGTSTMAEALDRGATQKQAIELGVTAGLAEAIMEKIPLDKLMSIRSGEQLKGLVGTILSQMGTEGLEEVGTEIANIFADAWIMGENSNWKTTISEYMAQGMSRDEATKKAFLDNLANVGIAFAGGALSGSVMGAGGQIANYYQVGKQYYGRKGTEGKINNPIKRTVKGAEIFNQYVEEVRNNPTVTPETVDEVVADCESLGMAETDVQDIRNALETLSGVPKAWSTPQAQQVVKMLQQTVELVARNTVQMDAELQAKVQESQGRLNRLYTAMLNAQSTAQNTDPQDILSYTKASQAFKKAVSEYKSALSTEEAKTTAETMKHDNKVADEQQKVKDAGAAVAAQAEVEKQATVDMVAAMQAGIDDADNIIDAVMNGTDTVAAPTNEFAMVDGAMGVEDVDSVQQSKPIDIIEETMNGGNVDGRQENMGDTESVVSGSEQVSTDNRPERIGEVGGETETDRQAAESNGNERTSAKEWESGIKAWDDDARTSLTKAVEDINNELSSTGKSVSESDIRMVDRPTVLAIAAMSKLKGVTGRDFFLFESDNPLVPNGFAVNGKQFVKMSRDASMLFHGAHEALHNDPQLKRAAMAAWESIEPVEREEAYNAMLAARNTSLQSTRGEEYTEGIGNDALLEEMFANLFGEYIYRAHAGLSAANSLGISEDVYAKFADKFDAVLKDSAILEEDDASKLYDELSNKGNGETVLSSQNIETMPDYDYSKSFAEQIDDYKKGKMLERDSLVLGGTPLLYQQIGFSALPMTIDQTHVRYLFEGKDGDEDHRLDIKTIKKLPELIANPIAIIESKTDPTGSVVVIIKATSLNGKKVIAAFDIGGDSRVNDIPIDSHNVSTVHGRKNTITGLLKDAIKKQVDYGNGMYYWNKNEALPLLIKSGLQLPGVPQQDGLIHSIFDAGSPVNKKFIEQPQTRQFRNWFKGSAVKNADGTARMVYHYTDVDDLDVFDTSLAGNNEGATLGDGIYVSTSPTEFSYAGKNRLILYASIKHPYNATKGLDRKKAEYIVEKYGSIKHDIEAFDGVYKEHAIGKLMNPLRAIDYIKEYAADAGIKTSDIFKELGYDGIHNGSEWVAFESKQLKSATDNIGLYSSSPNIHYSTQTLTSQPVPLTAKERHLREATDLYERKVPLAEYAKEKKYNKNVADLLRGMYLKNGIAQGGALSDADIAKITKDAKYWKEPKLGIADAFKYPVRMFEDMARWRDETSARNRMLNNEDSNLMRDTYYGFMQSQYSMATTWQNAEKAKIEKVLNKAGYGESAIAQMLGEGIIDDEQAKKARYDKNRIIIPVGDGAFVIDKNGNIEMFTDGTSVFQSYNLVEQAVNKVKGKAETKKLLKNGATAEQVAEAQASARESLKEITNGQKVRVITKGNSIEIRQGDEVLAHVDNGEKANVEVARDVADTLISFYDRVFELQNEALAENGYRPIVKRANYLPHLQRRSVGFEALIKDMRGDAAKLPTEIVGLTGAFSPGKAWAAHMQQRLGDFTEFDAIRGFNNYLRTASDIIYGTPVIQRIRQLEKTLREMAAKGATASTANSNTVRWLHEYANTLANKKSGLDREAEAIASRSIYTITDRLTSATSAASVAGSISSAMSNAISLVTAIPSVNNLHLARSMAETIRTAASKEDDGFSEKIPFLNRRFNSYEDILVNQADKTKKKVNDIMNLAFTAIDRFSVESVARAKYAELMEKGYTEQEAITQTDAYCQKLFADRSKGNVPQVFNSKILKPFTQFQLEVANQMSHFRDINRMTFDEGMREALKGIDINDANLEAISKDVLSSSRKKALLKEFYYLIMLSVYGLISRFVLGRDQTWNPAGMAYDFVEDVKDDGLKEAGKNIIANISEQAPFVSMLFGGGRIPIAGNIVNAAGNIADIFKEGRDLTAGEKALNAAFAVSYFVPGGGQARKTVQGIQAIKKGGNYTDAGNLRYPITEDDYWRTLLFGTSAAAPKNYEWGQAVLSEGKTEKYAGLVDMGIDEDDAYNFLIGYDAGTGVTNAQKGMQILESGFAEDDFDMVAEIMGLSYDPEKHESLKDWTIEQAENYIADKNKELEKGKITQEKYDSSSVNLLEDYLAMMMED